jgi:aminoglycoside/choline kinase family phosphotransferase
LAYDAAALILDPYVGHSPEVRDELWRGYLDRLDRCGTVDTSAVAESWYSLGAFRLLQALGAFGKLSGRFGKRGFLEHAAKALAVLSAHLSSRATGDYSRLRSFVDRCAEAWSRALATGLVTLP